MRWIASIAGGALGGGFLGISGGNAIVRQVCDAPGAGNLCGLAPSAAVPIYFFIGGVVGALITTLVATVLITKPNA
jgi:hypothetical protein